MHVRRSQLQEMDELTFHRYELEFMASPDTLDVRVHSSLLLSSDIILLWFSLIEKAMIPSLLYQSNYTTW